MAAATSGSHFKYHQSVLVRETTEHMHCLLPALPTDAATAQSQTLSVKLAAGSHPIVVEWMQVSGTAKVRLGRGLVWFDYSCRGAIACWFSDACSLCHQHLPGCPCSCLASSSCSPKPRPNSRHSNCAPFQLTPSCLADQADVEDWCSCHLGSTPLCGCLSLAPSWQAAVHGPFPAAHCPCTKQH